MGSPWNFSDMMSISYMDFGYFARGKTLWKITCLTLISMVWWERNARIFEDKWRTSETLWDLCHFFTSLRASCTNEFKGCPLNVIQLSWLVICTPLGLGYHWEEPNCFFRRGSFGTFFLWSIFLYKSPCIAGVFSGLDQVCIFMGRTPHPSHEFFIRY